MITRLSPKELALFTENLAVLVSADVPMAPALRRIAPKFRRRAARAAINTLATDLDHNLALSAALARQPKAFPSYSVALLAAGKKRAGSPKPSRAWPVWQKL